MKWTGRAGLVASLLLVSLMGALVWRFALDPVSSECASTASSRASLLAVGDFGQPPGRIALLDMRRSVALAMDDAHRCAPVDALLLLGDNFYPKGLFEENLVRRLRDTVVAPFCRFLSLSGPHAEELRSACRIASDERLPTRIIAVPGNHDYKNPQGAALEVHEVPRWLPEWEMPEEQVQAYEIAGGLSVIALDSVALYEGADWAPVHRALLASRGPWRILIAHHPLVVSGAPWQERYRSKLLRAIEETQRPIHLMLAGHEHHLAAYHADLPGIPLQLVAGSGARVREPTHSLWQRNKHWNEPGFARVDLVGEAGSESLRATLMATRRRPIELWTRDRALASYSISIDGEVSDASARVVRR